MSIVLSAGACSLRPSDTDSATPSAPEPGAPAATATVPGPVADVDLVTEVLRQLSVTHRVVRQIRGAHRSLEASLRPLERLHAAHARELGGLVPATGRIADPNEMSEAALAQVVSAETRLQRRLARAAIAAESGALAQLLASMTAALAQERSRL